MPLFRKPRRELNESLETTIVVKNLDDLRQAIYEDWEMWEGHLTKDGRDFNKDSFDIKIEEYGGLDKRCGWYTHLVSANLLNKKEFMCVGFLSEKL